LRQRLKGVFGRMAIAKNRGACVQHHGPVPLDEYGKSPFRQLIIARVESLKKLPIRQFAHRPCVKERLDVSSKSLLALCRGSYLLFCPVSPLACPGNR
jgi:hypothetical protein